MGIIKVAPPPVDRNIVSRAVAYIVTIGKGMMLTMRILLRQLFRLEKSQTVEWPEEPATYGPRFKGKHFLTRRDDGQIRCTACFLCATACPAQCIHIEAGQNPDRSIEKFPVRFEIDILRCVFCGYCEEACPVDAIRLGPEYAIVDTAEKKWVYTKDYLTARPQLDQGIHSIKEESEKHPTINEKNPSGDARRSQVRHGHH